MRGREKNAPLCNAVVQGIVKRSCRSQGSWYLGERSLVVELLCTVSPGSIQEVCRVSYGSASPRQRRRCRARVMVALLPATARILRLHLSAGRDAQRWARNRASRRVHYGDRIASPLRERLVQLHLRLLLLVAGAVGIGCAGKEERGRGLHLLLQRRAFRRARR